MPAPALTAIVPTRDRPDLLRRCLEALAGQVLDGELEVVVVDDGSSDAEAVQRATAGYPATRIVRLPGMGVGAARNSGARAASGEAVCFTDDDCVPEPDWASVLVSELRTAPVVAGMTVNGDGSDVLAEAAQLLANALLDDPAGTAAPGSNLACRRQVVDRVPFDESYAGIGAEDRDWFARVAAAGYEVALAEGAVVRHFPRLTWRAFLAKSMRYGRGAYRFRHAHRQGRLAPPGFYARLLRNGFSAGALTGAAVCAGQVATAAGFLGEALSSHLGTRTEEPRG